MKYTQELLFEIKVRRFVAKYSVPFALVVFVLAMAISGLNYT